YVPAAVIHDAQFSVPRKPARRENRTAVHRDNARSPRDVDVDAVPKRLRAEAWVNLSTVPTHHLAVSGPQQPSPPGRESRARDGAAGSRSGRSRWRHLRQPPLLLLQLDDEGFEPASRIAQL